MLTTDMTTIPGAFVERCLWTLDDTSNFSTLAPDTSSNADGNSRREFRVSTGITTQINFLVSFAFDNIESSRQPDVPFLDASLDNKAIVLACTQSQGAQIVDTVIKQVAFQQGADVLVLDALDLARGRFGVLGRGAEVIDKLYTAVQHVYKSEDSEKEEKPDTPAVVPLNEDVLRFFDALFATTAANCSKEPNRRIIYLRNFQIISKVAKPLIAHVLHSLYTPSKGNSYPPEPYPAPPSKKSSVLVFGTNNASSLVISAKPSSVEKDFLFLSALFSDARSSTLAESATSHSRSRWERYMMGKFMDSDSDDSESEEGWSLGTVDLDPIPFNAEMGKKVDELAIGALKASVFAADVKAKAEEEGWQKEAQAKQIRSMNEALLSACLGAGCRPCSGPDDIEDVSACSDVPSKGLLSVQAAKSIVYSALGAMATITPAGEPSKIFKDCLEESCKAHEKRKKEQEEWAKGVDSTQEVGKGNGETESTPKEDIDKLIEGVSRHARELGGCIVDTGSMETTFSNVFVESAIIESLQTIVSLPLLYPSYFKSGVLASEAIGGILLYGPPGTGKTMLCRALAKTSKARMIHIRPSDINDKYVGESEKKVAAVFELAYKLAPCIVFVDEIDALFSSRNCSTRSWERNILTEFMQGMDGLGSAKKNRDNNIVVVGATNRPFDLDLAILRRMPRRILVDMPNVEMRKGILGFYLKNEEVEEGVSVEQLGMETEGFSGSDLKNLCVAAALASVKEAIGPKWNDDPSPPTPPKTPTNDTDSKVMDAQELSKEGEEEESKNDSIDLPVRRISSANFRQARNEVVKSNAGGRLDELYKWHSDHSTSSVSGRKPTVGGYAGGSGVSAGGYGAGTFGARYGAGGYGTSGHGAGYAGGTGSVGDAGTGGGGFGLGNLGVGGFGLGGLGTAGLGADTDFRLPLSRLNQTKPYWAR